MRVSTSTFRIVSLRENSYCLQQYFSAEEYRGYSLPVSSVKSHFCAPLPRTLAIKADETSKEVSYKTVGDLLIKDSQLTQAYWQKPTETANAFVNGWFKTGDIVTMEENGFVSIVDRTKDMISSTF